MNYFSMAVLALGAGIVAWMGSAFMMTNTLALLVVVAIALCYGAGIVELVRFQRDTLSLKTALAHLRGTTVELEDWLVRLPLNCRNPVQQRIRGEGGALPTLVMTPHLTGLLVMLGLLGTFVGMVVTLQGAVAALENTTELDAIRSAMTAPIKGLGLAFGTSVAGVSASAALGLVATLWRRERQRVVRELDAQVSGVFHSQSLPAYRERVLDALQHQAAAVPELVTGLLNHGQDLERFLERVDRTLAAGQDRFHEQMITIHRELAASVGDSLRHSLAEGGRLAGASIRPVVEEAMAAISVVSQDTQHAVRDGAREQLHAVVQHLETTSAQLNGQWLDGLGQLVEGIRQLRTDASEAVVRDQALLAQQEASLTRIGELVTALAERSATQQEQLSEQARSLGDVTHDLATRFDQHGQQQTEQAAKAHESLIQHLSGHYRELTRQMGDEFCGVVASHSRQTLEQVEPLRREQLALGEQLAALVETIQIRLTDQHEALTRFIADADSLFEASRERAEQQLNSGTTRLSEAADAFAVGVTELTNLGDALAQWATAFEAANGQLQAAADQLENAVLASAQRSDEQMGYYIAQAREVIDYSVQAQQALIEQMRQLTRPA